MKRDIVTPDDKSAGKEKKDKHFEDHTTEKRDDREEIQIENITPTVEEKLMEDHRKLQAEQNVLPRGCPTRVQTRSGRLSCSAFERDDEIHAFVWTHPRDKQASHARVKRTCQNRCVRHQLVKQNKCICYKTS